ncbi:MAG: hypothetical protein J6N72_01390 [Psychrobacter sp.]|nr:hypothetical protein [Psychrobacter sp.]
MLLRPIDAIFVHPKQRVYVVYYRGELWQLPRMKIDDRSWQNKRLYTDDSSALYLSTHQTINDPVLSQKLRTLNLPVAVHGSTLPRFEAWWETHGFKWLKDKLMKGQSPLAGHQASTKAIDNHPTSASNYSPAESHSTARNSVNQGTALSLKKDVFAEMLAELTEEVLHQPL